MNARVAYLLGEVKDLLLREEATMGEVYEMCLSVLAFVCAYSRVRPEEAARRVREAVEAAGVIRRGGVNAPEPPLVYRDGG